MRVAPRFTGSGIGGLTVGLTVGFTVEFTVGLTVEFTVEFTVGLTFEFTVGFTVEFTVGFTVRLRRGTRTSGILVPMQTFDIEQLAQTFTENRERLLALIRRNLRPILLKRLSYEDVLSTVYENAAKRLAYFAANEDVPVYFKFRTILLQTLTDLERRHLAAESRDAYKETASPDFKVEGPDGDVREMEFAADITSPVSHVDRDERHRLLRAAIDALPENDRRIIALRHFDDLGNAECAAVLGIEPKAASIRYVRALERLEKKLLELSCFRKS